MITELTREQIEELLSENEEPILLMDGFDPAFTGLARRCGQPTLAVYSWEKMVDVLVTRDGMDTDEAIEFIDYNCLGAWVGELTPIIVMPPNY